MRLSGMDVGRYDLAAYLTSAAYAAGSVVVPVALVQLAADLDFPLSRGGMADAGVLHLGRTITMVAAMLLCGFAAGRWGKRRSMGVSVALMGVGVLLCAVSPVYGVLLLGLLLAGLGEGVVEGLATPFVAALHPVEPGRYVNLAHAFWSVGVLITVLATGGLLWAQLSWRYPVAIAGAAAMVASALILLPRRRGAAPYPDAAEPVDAAGVWQQSRDVLRCRRFWLYFAAMFVAGGGEFCLTFWTASYIELNVHAAPWAGGVGTACFALGMFVGRALCGLLVPQHRLRLLLITSAALGVAVTLLLPWITGLVTLLAALTAAGLATAPYWPSIQSHADQRLPTLDSTMLLVLLSCAGVPGCGVLTFLMGLLGDATGSLQLAFLLVPACYLTLLILILCDHPPTPAF